MQGKLTIYVYGICNFDCPPFATLNVTQQVKVGPGQLPGDCSTAYDILSPVTQVCLDGWAFGEDKITGEIAGNNAYKCSSA